MDLNATIDIIIKDLLEAGEIIDDLKRYPGVPELQVELAKSKCKSASEVISLFKNLPGKTTTVMEEKPVVQDAIRQEQEILKTAQADQVLEKDFSEVAKPHKPETISAVEAVPVQPFKKPAESAIIADQFSNRPESFNETLGSHMHEDDVLEILKTKPLQSLNEAIGINDKFLFIREIFDGNVERYNQAIIKLESVGSLADARTVIISYSGENSESEAIKQLLDLIKRKFPSNE
jgi:cystathionine beta-lyase family protein involved in aluminum resistance